MIDRILVRLSDDLEMFLAGVSVAHNYLMQQARQVAQGQKDKDGFQLTIELGHEEQFFFVPLFPRLNIRMREANIFPRSQWECIVDLTDRDRAIRVGAPQKKHVTESLGVMCGASPGKIGEMGVLMFKVGQPSTDILIDQNIAWADELKNYVVCSYPHLRVEVKATSRKRAALMFDDVANTRMYVGHRSAATYLVAMMKKELVEMSQDGVPAWALDKNPGDNYRAFYGSDVCLESVWLACTEVLESATWNTKDLNSLVDQSVVCSPSIAEAAGVK